MRSNKLTIKITENGFVINVYTSSLAKAVNNVSGFTFMIS